MKKMMFAAAVAAVAGIAGAIESANTVGYATLTAGQGKWTMVGVQFEDTGTTSKNLLEYVKTSATAVTKANMDNGAMMLVMGSNGAYTSYYYLSDAFDSDAFDADFDWDAWEELSEEDEDAAAEMYDNAAADPKYYSEGWALGNSALVTSIPVDIGDSVWYYNAGQASELTLSGEVNGTASFPIPCASGMSMIANPYPTALKFNNIAFSTLTPAASTDDAVLLMVMGTSGTYSTYYYLADAFDSDAFDADFDWDAWEELSEEDEDAAAEMYDNAAADPKYHKTGWALGNSALVTGDVTGVGYGFWIQMPSADTVTFTK